MLRRFGRSYLPLIPTISAFLLTEWFVITGTGSFTEILSFTGVILVSLLAGILPDLLMVASRRKGERLPAVTYRLLGHPFIVAGVYILFLVILFLYGLVIWQDALPRALALLVGVATVGMTIAMMRQGAFVKRTVLELLEDQGEGGRAFFTITEAGEPRAAEVSLQYPDREEKLQAPSGEISSFSSLRRATVQLSQRVSLVNSRCGHTGLLTRDTPKASKPYSKWIQKRRRENLTSDCPTEKLSSRSMVSHAS